MQKLATTKKEKAAWRRVNDEAVGNADVDRLEVAMKEAFRLHQGIEADMTCCLCYLDDPARKHTKWHLGYDTRIIEFLL